MKFAWRLPKFSFGEPEMNRFVWLSAKRDLISGLFFIPVYALAEVVLALSLGTLMQLIFSGKPRISLSQIIPTQLQHWLQFNQTLDRKDLAAIVPAVIVAAGLLKFVGNFFSSYLIERSGHCVSRNLRQELLGRVLNAKANTIDSLSLEDLSNRILGDTAQMQSLLTKGSISALRDGIVLFFLIVSMFLLAPKLMVVLTCVLLPAFWILRKVSAALAFYTNESLKRTSDMGTQVVQLWSNRLSVYALGAQKIEHQRMVTQTQNYFTFIKKSFVLRTGFRPLMELSAAVLIAGLFTLKLSAQSKLDASTVTTLLVLGAMSYRPLKQLAGLMGLKQEVISVYLRVWELWNWLKNPPSVERTYLTSGLRSDEAVNVKNLFVTLAGGKTLLKDCSLTVKLGESVGIVGQSGAGKSTFLRALAGTLSPSQGTVQVLESKLLAPQFPFMFSASVLDNILYPTNKNDDTTELIGAVETNRIQNLVLSLGLAQNQTMVDFFLQRNAGFMGANLSGGEKARVSLARILLRSPKLLLLDEPTANLDAESTRIFWQTVHKWKNVDSLHTLICVSHAQAEWVHFKRIIEMRDGQILAEQVQH